MDAVLRATAVYFFLLVIFRIAGERTLAKLTTFDFVLLLIIAEATQQGLIGDDFSITKVFLVVTTLVGIDIGLGLQRMDQIMYAVLERTGEISIIPKKS